VAVIVKAATDAEVGEGKLEFASPRRELAHLADEIFILNSGPIERLGGMERFLQYVSSGFQERGYRVRVFHAENSCPKRWQQPTADNKLQSLVASALHGYYIGKAARVALHPGVRLVLSNSTVGWYPFGEGVRHAQFFHGTYRGQAEVIRPFIKYRGYLRLKWWDSMLLERLSGKNSIALCCSEQIQDEIRLYFGYEAQVMWYPIDLDHFRSLDKDVCRRQLGIRSKAVGLYVGSTHPMKGFATVIHVAKRFPEITMLVAVRGAVPSEIENLPNVRVFHDATYDLLPLLYNAADFSMCPSRYDPFPFVVSEALASGTPVIASPHGASLTFYNEPALRQLLVSSTDDLEGFERAARQVLSDPPGWRELIQTKLRPRLVEMMAPVNWWSRFQRVVGI
jgi:glycosyltransferase involved in cell wall biosynthesis